MTPEALATAATVYAVLVVVVACLAHLFGWTGRQ